MWTLLLYELFERERGWRFTPRCHTETIAKLARLGPAKNGTTPPEFGLVGNVLLDDLEENPKKPCRAYHEDQCRCGEI